MPITQQQIKQLIEEYYPLYNLQHEQLDDEQSQTLERCTYTLIQFIEELAQRDNIDIASSTQQEKDTLIASYKGLIQEPLKPFITRWEEDDMLSRYTAVKAQKSNNVPDNQIDPLELSLFNSPQTRQEILANNVGAKLIAFLGECEGVARDHFLSIPPRTPSPKHRRIS